MVTYKSSGVDISAGRKAVELIRKKAEQTFRHYSGEVLLGIGGFGAAVLLSDGRVMGLAVDGVGTKLLIAQLLDEHNTIGINLVAMNANDLAVINIKPELFLNYIAMGKQIPERTAGIIGGIIDGCEQSSMALVGGEMAEMPGMYKEEHYDLAGFAIGFATSRDMLITGENIKPGMRVYGFSSSGVHSNGFGLIRKVFGIDPQNSWKAQRALNRVYPELGGKTLGEELLIPTTIYVELIRDLCVKYDIAGMVHVTGGGLIDNPPRIMPDGCTMCIDLNSWKVPEIFLLIKKRGKVSLGEMLRTFNMGLGLLVVSPDEIPEGILVGKIVSYGEGKVLLQGGQHLSH